MKWLCVLALAAALPALAQNGPRGNFAWWDSPVAKNLNLSPEQRQKVQATVHDSRSNLIDLRAAVQKAELDVDDAFNADPFDMRKASDAVERLSVARGNASKALAQLSLNLRAVLTTEQWKELQRRHPGLLRNGMGRMGGHLGMGPGMGRGPMGPGMQGRGMMRQRGGMGNGPANPEPAPQSAPAPNNP